MAGSKNEFFYQEKDVVAHLQEIQWGEKETYTCLLQELSPAPP